MVGDEATKMNQLDDQMKSSEDTLFKRKKELQRLQMDIEAEQNRIRELEIQYKNYKDHNENLNAAHAQVKKELESEKERLSKVSKKVEKQIKEFRSKRNVAREEKTVEETVLEAYSLKEVNNSLLYTLGQLANEFPELSDLLNITVKKQNLHIPAIPPGRGNSSRGFSTTDSRPTSARSDRRYYLHFSWFMFVFSIHNLILQ